MPLADTLNRKPGDILKSDDWNIIIKEIDRLETAKINRDGADTLKGPLTIAESLKVNSNVTISGNLSVTNVLEIGTPPFAGNTGGNRDWMQKGIKINWDSDSLFIGLKNEGTNRKDAVIAWGDDPQDDLRFVNVLAGGEVQGKELMRIKPSGNVGIGTNNPIASLDIASASRTGTHPTAVKGLYITGDFNADNDGVEFRHSSGTQGIGFGFNTIYAAGSAANQDLGLKPKGTGEVKVAGSLSVSGIVKAQTLTVSGDLSVTGSVSFGSQVRQMLNLWSTGYGIGIQNMTQYFRSDYNFAWYQGGSHNDAELNAGGGRSLMTLDSNGNLSVSGIVKIGSLQLGGFTSEDKQEWPIVVWYRNTDQNWDEGLIKLPASQGVFRKAGFGIHLHKNRQFGFWSTGPIQLFAVEGDTGNTYIRGNLDLQGSAFLGYESDISNFGTPLKSGFYQNGSGREIPGDVPDTSHPWTHLITARHSNTSNNHQLQIASTFINNDRLFFRKVAAGLETNNPGWNEVATRGGNTFVGNQIINGTLVTQQTHTIKIGVPGASYGNDGIRGEPNLWLDAAGTVIIKKGFQSQGMDVAERFKVLGHGEIGSVMVMDEQEKAIKLCERAYDPCVVGIISGEPAFILGLETEHQPIALCGRVPCNVDADIAPIKVGDLLTTSPTKGYAQKALEIAKATGTIIGKALESLSQGKGQITVLVILQ
jgi:cytoskeletal protein CcmA (bactofilin family)